jgi:parvulin-like peptidyl-prolyl isomerase
MKIRFLVIAGLVLAGILTYTGPAQAQTGLPLKNGRPVVATVNADSISLAEFFLQLDPSVNRARLGQGRGTAKEVELLDRLVTIKLIAQEGRTMGLDELADIKKQVEVSSREILREVLLKRLVANVQPDPVAVRKVYREMVREWKTASLLFQDEASAQRARMEIANGTPFDQVASKAVADKKARTDQDSGYHARKDYLPQIADEISKLEIGGLTPVLRLQTGFALVKVVGIRYPENTKARTEARQRAVKEREDAVLKAHETELRRKYVVMNEAVVKGLNYETAPGGVDGLLKDKRVLAEIKGAAPVTVGDLTDYLRMQFFHGTDEAKQRKEMNERKDMALEAMIGRRLLNAEAVRMGIDKTNEYRDRVNGYKESLVFDAFVQKVIAPENKMKEEDVKAYYTAHVKEYSYPEMLKVRSLAFTARPAAESAIRKLREGTDYGWLASNAEGQAAKGTLGLLTLDGRPVTTDSMPAGLQKALAGSKPGDHRLYASPEGPVYVVAVEQVIGADAKPYDEVRMEIARKLYNEKLKKAVDDYARKLRAQAKVAVYLKRMK